ncbi:MAG: flagellar basal body rod protein [bacterium]|nr:flagellar basal body rod protein [bacterium]
MTRDDVWNMDALGIALTGMQSAGVRVAVSAHNVANTLTEDFRPQRVVQSSLPGGGAAARVQQADRPAPVSLAREVVGQMQASVQYDASARVFAVGAEMKGSLIDLLG